MDHIRLVLSEGLTFDAYMKGELKRQNPKAKYRGPIHVGMRVFGILACHAAANGILTH